MQDPMYTSFDRTPNRGGRKRNNGGAAALIAITAILLVTVSIVLMTMLFGNPGSDSDSSESNPSGDANVILATPSPSAEPSAALYENSVLYPASAQINVPMGTPGDGVSPAERGVIENVFQGDNELAAYVRSVPVAFLDPLEYQSVPGILTFRGNNFRNCASWGTVPSAPTTLEQTWEYSGLGSLLSSSWDYSWFGTGWTGQPVVITWSDAVRQTMNLYPEKKAKQGLTEVIQAAMDGKVYFFDIDDGSPTRDPLDLGFTVKGTPCLDPRGYPILYIGQGDNNGKKQEVGFRIISLIDFSVLYYQDGLDSRAYRSGWGACDSSPIVNASSDTLIFPNENGMIYTLKLNTTFDPTAKTLSINPENTVYRFMIDKVQPADMGIESSMSVYDHFGYFNDSSGNLSCVDLNTLKMVWSRHLNDDSDVTPVIEEENGRVYLYTGTEVDWQRTDVLEYLGASYTYKIDAMSGEIVWQTSEDCYTANGTDKANDVNGGMLGTPIVGKKSIDNLVIFSYCMTKGKYSGNRLVAFDKETGEKVWTYEMNQYSWSSPVDCYDADGNAYIVICDGIGQVHLVDAKTGVRITYLQAIRFKGTDHETKSGLNMESSPIVFNDKIIIGARSSPDGGSVFCIKIK